MTGRICYIFAAGDPYDGVVSPASEDVVIAVDGGYQYVWEHRIAPDAVIGDFDSLKETFGSSMFAPMMKSLEKHPCVITLKPEKDETDMYAAIQTGLEKGCSCFYLYGGTGGRTAHTVSNIQCLTMLAEKNCRGYLFAPRNPAAPATAAGEIMTVLHGTPSRAASITFAADSAGFVSVYSLSTECTGVSETGLKYRLSGYTLKNDYPVGTSNEFTGTEAVISVENGSLLVVYTAAAREICPEK